MRTAVVALIALAVLALPSPVAAAGEEGDGRPQDVQLTPIVDGSTIVSWSPPLTGAPTAYHVFRTRGVAAGEADWIYLGSTDALSYTDPDHHLEDDLVQGYRVVAEHASGSAIAQVYGLLRFPPDAALATADQDIVRIHATGGKGCFPVTVSGIPPSEVSVNAPCMVENVAQFLPEPAEGLVLCGFYTLWGIASPVLTGVGGGQQTMGGQGCVQA